MPERKPEMFPLVEYDGEPRVRDVEIGERLGMTRPTNIRQVIQVNRAEIEGFGGLHSARANPGPQGGRPTEEFWLNEEQALCVATLSNAPRAPDVRRMLILTFTAYRKGLLPGKAVINVRDPAQHAQITLQVLEWNRELQEENSGLWGQVVEMAPKALVYDEIVASDGTCTPTVAAKQIRQPPRAFVKWLEEHKWLKREADGNLIPFQDKLNRGWMILKMHPFTRPDGSQGQRPQALFTHKGLCRVAQEIYVGRERELWDVLNQIGGEPKLLN